MAVSVLVVDDDPQWRAFMRRLVVAAGLTVVAEAESVQTAIEAARRHQPAAALVDLGLPDGDGAALAGDLRALPSPPRIVLTSTDPDGMRGCDLEALGIVAFVSKAELPDTALHALLAEG
jgi:DNA-binding NarL/FixJ family response regulator